MAQQMQVRPDAESQALREKLHDLGLTDSQILQAAMHALRDVVAECKREGEDNLARFILVQYLEAEE